MSVAQLGFAVDSSQLVAAKKNLDAMTAAAKPAAQAAAEIGKASSGAAANAASLASAAEKAANGGAKALTTQTGLARHELINLSRQLQDVGVSLVSGQSPFMVLAQQGAQIADIFGSSKTGTVGGALKQIGSGILSVLTPMRLLGIGIGAVGVGAVVAANSVSKSSMALDDLAKSINTTLPLLHGLEQVSGGRGISSDDFAKGMKSFGDEVYRAQRGMGDLVGLLRANGKSAKDFQGYMQAVADLVGRTTTDQNAQKILTEAGLPASEEWVRVFRDLARGIDVATAGTVKFNTEAEKNLVAKAREFDHAWNTATTQVSNYLKSTVIEATDWFGKLSKTTLTIAAGIGAALAVALAPFSLVAATLAGVAAAVAAATAYVKGSSTTDAAAEASGRPRVMINGGTQEKKPGPEPKTREEVQHDLQIEQQHIALLGQTATAADAVRSVELQVAQARLNDVSITQKQVDVLKKLAYEQSIGVTQIKASIDSYNIETATVGMSAGAAAQYAAAQNAINEAHRAGRVLTQDNIAAINAQAAALGDAAAKADLMQSAYSGLVRGPLQTLTSQIANGAKFFDALKSAGISALNSIASKLAEMAAQGLWTSAFGGASSGGGLIGSLSRIFSGGGTAGLDGLAAIHHTGGIVGSESNNLRSVSSTMFATAPRFHSGLLPDEFPAILQKGEGVFTRGQMAAMSGAANSNAPQDINIKVDVTGARGSQEISDAVNEGVGRALNAYRGSIAQVNDVAAASKKAGMRRLGR